MKISAFLKYAMLRGKTAGMLLFVLPVLYSCNSEKKAADSDTSMVSISDSAVVGTATGSSQPQKPGVTLSDDSLVLVKGMLSELDRMKLAFSGHDAAQVASFFDFPVSDTAMVFFDINPDFDAAYKANGSKVTKAMFSKHFRRIEEFHSMSEFNSLFKYLKPEGLLTSNVVEHEHRIKDDGCYYLYSIRRLGLTLILTYGTNTNSEYTNPDPDQGEVCGEFASSWFFEFRDGKLHFQKQMTAG